MYGLARVQTNWWDSKTVMINAKPQNRALRSTIRYERKFVQEEDVRVVKVNIYHMENIKLVVLFELYYLLA